MKAARILLVEDDHASAQMLTRLFKSGGHETIAVETAEHAFEAAANGVYDLVLLDQVLPGATGMQSLRKLRSMTRAPIYLMSGYNSEDTRVDAELLGARGFLPKPLDINEVLKLIADLPERRE
jgi:two-component system response regulator FlrC